MTHLFDEKNITIETVRKDRNLRRRTRSEKVSDSARRTINFITHMGLSFEHTKDVGARDSENKVMEW